jgi:hypothetical protein
MRKLGFVALPIVLPEISKLPKVPAELIPVIEPEFEEVVPIASRFWMVLFCMVTVLTLVPKIPTIAPPELLVAV